MNEKDLHLDVYTDRSIFYYNGKATVFEEGKQSVGAQKRYKKVTEELTKGYLEDLYKVCGQIDTSSLDESTKSLLTTLVDGITSETGRALAGLTFLQITIKSIVPEQSVRLHKGSSRSGSFSWKEGISLRTIDSTFITPFLREKKLLNMNKYGFMMTRSLAENYPYSQLYKAEMRGPFGTWIKIIDLIENTSLDFKALLAYLMSLLINRSAHFKELSDSVLNKLNVLSKDYSYEEVENLLIGFCSSTQYSARAFEVVIHGFMQAYVENGLTDLSLAPMSQMRSANKKYGNIGDIELKDGPIIMEAWDAKYGKSYLYDELNELQDKLLQKPGVKIAGFIVNDFLDLKDEIKEKSDDVSAMTGTEIQLFTFRDWTKYKLKSVSNTMVQQMGMDWLKAVVETFALKRLDIAPIDEPCEKWLTDIGNLLD
ncbi:MAG: hypothetical protein K6A82_08010 [Prevotella sp.]|nr:hypothetical protein [Prevotella sp.]